MFEYFFRQQDDIPAGMGYPLFGAAHLLSVAVTLTLVIATVVLSRRLDNSGKRDRAIPITMLILEFIKDGVLITLGRFGIGYLPLHVCSIGVFVFLLREFVPEKNSPGTRSETSYPGDNSKGPGLKPILGEIAVILIMPAALAGLIFADWTELYPVLNFFNLHSYLWHGLLILYPLILLIRGDVQPSIRHIHWVILFLCIIVPPVYIFDKFTGCNYFFVNRPVPGSPLEWLSRYLGNPGYLLGYGALTIIVILMVYLIIHAVQNLCHG